MPLYIRDDEVAELAREVKRITGAKTVTEAVRASLERSLATARPVAAPGSLDRFAKALALADAMGASDHSVDMKAFMDELSGE